MSDIFFPITERPLYFPSKSGEYLPTKHKAVVRADTDGKPSILAVVKDSYKVIKHKEVYDAVMDVVGVHDVDVSTYFDRLGQSAYIDVQFKRIVARLGTSDHLFRAIFRNGYGDTAFSMIAGAINMFCTNGMILGQYERAWKRHVASLDIAVAKDWLKTGMSAFTKDVDWMEHLRSIVADPHRTAKRFRALSESDGHASKMADKLPHYVNEYGANEFAVYNTLTDYGTHYASYRDRQAPTQTGHLKSFKLLARAADVMKTPVEKLSMDNVDPELVMKCKYVLD